MTQDRASAEEYIETLTGSKDTKVCFRILYVDKAQPGQNFTDSLANLWKMLCRQNDQRWNVYMVVNEGGHKNEDICKVRAIFVDGDGVQRPKKWHAFPDLITQRDATHWHAYWVVNDCPPERFEEAQRTFANHYGTDPKICNLARVMRVPGFKHWKL